MFKTESERMEFRIELLFIDMRADLRKMTEQLNLLSRYLERR